MDNGRTNWIWIPDWDMCDKDTPGLVLFRNTIFLEKHPKVAKIRISADTRYKLYINERLVEIGPSRGDRQIWYYDEPDLIPYLKKGKNIIAVKVLRYPTEHSKGNHGMYRTEFPGLYITGYVTDVEGNVISINADESWRCKKDSGFHVVSENPDFAPLQIYEVYQADEALHEWMKPEYDDHSWQQAMVYPFMSEAVSPGNLHQRTIPFLYRKEKKFSRIIRKKSLFSLQEWENVFLAGKLMIPPNTEEIVEIDAGEEMTAYLRLALTGGKGAIIRLLQAESYFVPDENGNLKKMRRDDHENGCLRGHTDIYYPSGCADIDSEDSPEIYEPFWFRTFRFIRLRIKTADMPLSLCDFSYTETGYPLGPTYKPSVSDERLDAIWEISERSLRRCMHETYEDCPFYEQLQYAMDARSEILYTYATTGDDRLARKCIDDFKRSQRYDGMLNCSYPNYGPNIIPGFSIYYILMLYDHMMYFGDKELLTDHMPIVERVIRFFHCRLSEKGYVKKLGGLNGQSPKWSFIDWTEQWRESTGVPTAIYQGPITMESLLYVLGLQYAAQIADYLEYAELAASWLEEAEKVQSALRKYCIGKNGMFQDGPGCEEYSQHTQVFAILTDTVDSECGKANLEETLLHPEQYAQCSVAMMHYLFAAMRKVKLYAFTQDKWDIWDKMIKKGVTTCVEDDIYERSDCHAWGSIILYEIPAIILGVRPSSPGYSTIKIAPEPGYLTYAEGHVPTPFGMVYVRWTLENGGKLEYQLPDHVEAEIDDTVLKNAALQNEY